MRVALLYICTGKYNQFFAGFYNSSEKYFLKGIADKEYFVFTDDMTLSSTRNVHLIQKECQGFPADSLFRFEMFLKIKDILKDFDYIYFFNANTEFKQFIGTEILPSKNVELVGAEWPGKRKPFKHPIFFPYERNKHSLSYIPPFESEPYIYYMGGINGGTSRAYIEMIETLALNIRKDYENGIIAIVHDESHINKYFRNHKCLILTPEYCWPEEWACKFSPKIIFRDKVKVNNFFNKGRDNSLMGKVKKSFYILWRALKWFI